MSKIRISSSPRGHEQLELNFTKSIINISERSQANINYYFTTPITTNLISNNKRLYKIGEIFYDESQIFDRFKIVNGTPIGITKPAFKEVEEIQIVSTNLISKNLGTFNLPNAGFNSSLFKSGTWYLYIQNGVLKLASSFTDVTLTGTVTLFELRYELQKIVPNDFNEVLNTKTGFIDMDTLSVVEPNLEYFPYITTDFANLYAVRMRNSTVLPSSLKQYVDYKLYDTYTEITEDPLLKYVSTFREITEDTTDEDIEAYIEEFMTINDNCKVVVPFTKRMRTDDRLRILQIRDLDNITKSFYGIPFTQDTVFFYMGKLYKDARLVTVQASPGLDGKIVRDIRFNYALFPTSIVPSRLSIVRFNHSEVYYYSIDEDGSVVLAEDFETGLFTDNIRSYVSHMYQSFNKSITDDETYINSIETNNVAILNENGLCVVDEVTPINEQIILERLQSSHLNISLPDNSVAFVCKSCKLVDVTDKQDPDLLTRGIFILPDRFHLLFINGQLTTDEHYVNLYMDFKKLNEEFHPTQIHDIKIYVDDTGLVGKFNDMYLDKRIQFNKDTTYGEYYKDVYFELDEYIPGDTNHFVPINSYKGGYDRLYNYLNSDEFLNVLTLPEGDPRVEQTIARVKKAFKEFNVESLDMHDSDDRIVIPTGGNKHRFKF